jgi:hypothetical protein
MISLLIPTREKFENLKVCLDSFINLSKSLDNFEILLAMDNDDIETIKKIQTYITEKNVSNIFIIEGERMYYANFHKYMLRLFEKSKGNLLWLLADDVEVKTLGWDDTILKHFNDSDFLYAHVKILGHEVWNFSLVPIIQRKWVEITERISENSQTDLWLGHIAEDLNIIYKINEVEVSIFQDANGLQHNSGKFYTSDQEQWNIDKSKLSEYLNLKNK